MPTLTYLGHSGFVLEGDGQTVAIDPWLTGNPTATRSAEEIRPHTILLTHAHNDHVGDTIAIARRTGAKVIAPNELGIWLKGQGVAEATGANHGGTVAFDGGTVKLVPAWHSSSFHDGSNYVAVGVPAGLVVRFGGKTIYFAGDTCLFGDMQLIGEEGLDVAVLPIGDHYTMGPTDAVRAARFLNAKTVIPCHYNTFPAIKQDAQAFKQEIETRTPSHCTILAPGESCAV
jgi:L-ascorbate metabolism protein UlaG (beta-lactamase superfamily)